MGVSLEVVLTDKSETVSVGTRFYDVWINFPGDMVHGKFDIKTRARAWDLLAGYPFWTSIPIRYHRNNQGICSGPQFQYDIIETICETAK
jgi:hypothetical protein